MMQSWITVDAQWGSTGKGLINGYLARTREADVVVSMNGRNSGHTYVFEDGRKIINYTLPTGFISPTVKHILLGPDSVICPDTLDNEFKTYFDLLKGKKLLIHPHATIIHNKHKELESNQLNQISSTLQGVGAAQVDKIMRKKDAVAKYSDSNVIKHHVCDTGTYTRTLMEAKKLQIEGCQGFELSLNSGHEYPYVTSREITTHSILSGCAVPYSIKPEVIAVARIYPIRVGHAYDNDGNKIGDSGPYYNDQCEFTWNELGIEEERTTCTNKVRRIFSWSKYSFKKALVLLSPNSMFLNFVNYIDENPEFGKGVFGATVHRIENTYHLNRDEYILPHSFPFIKWAGIGPKHSDIILRPEMGLLTQ